MRQQSKRKNKYALIMVLEKEDGTIRKHTISQIFVEAAAVMLFILVAGIICRFVYDSIAIRNARKEIVSQTITINNLTDEYEALSIENAMLSDKIAVLGETVSNKAEAEDAISQEMIENALPKGYPLSGAADMEETSQGEPMLVFTAANGTNVITSGTGSVASVEEDEVYGTRIVIDHGNGYQSIYRNGGIPLVTEGQALGKGYILFTLGKDNQKLGYQIMQNDQLVDPTLFIDING